MRLATCLGLACTIVVTALIAQSPVSPTAAEALPPIDPQRVQDQQDMTWADYRPIPGVNWADPSLVASRKLRVAVDFPDQPFARRDYSRFKTEGGVRL